VTLPVYVRTETLREYRTEPYVRSADEAKALAESGCRDRLDALLSDAELASVERADAFDGERYTVTERVYLIKDIALKAPFDPDGKEAENDTENDND
jgi:hypothetical protein